MTFRFRSFQQKLGLYRLVLTFVPMLALSVSTYYMSRRELRLERERLMEGFAHEIGQSLKVELDEAAHDLRLWGHMAFLHDAMSHEKPEEVIKFFNDVMEHQRKYDLLCAFDRDGRIFAVNSADHEMKSIDSRSLIGQPWQTLFPGLSPTWFDSMMSQRRIAAIGWDKIEAVNRLYNRAPGKTKTEDQYQIALAVPIQQRSSDAPMGALLTVLNWAHFQNALDSAGDDLEKLGLSSGYAYLLAADGDRVIGHRYRDEASPFGNLYGTSLRRDHDLGDLADRALTKPDGTFPYTWRGDAKIVALYRVKAREELPQEFEWRLGVGITQSDIYAPSRKVLFRLALISLSVVLSVLGLHLFLRRRLTVSLKELTQFVRDAAAGRVSQLAPARSDDEIGKLGEAFNEMLVSFRTRLPFTPLPNPYVVGNPIRTSSMFFGREEDLQWAAQKLERPGNEMILLFGPRRIGKTSLLHQIAAGRATPRVLPFFFDTQQFIPELASDADFYHVITRDMLRQLSTVLPGSGPPFIADDRYTANTLRRLLKFLNEASGNRIPVLLFDEFENLEYKFRSGALTADLLLFLGGLLDGEPRVSFVATGSDQLENLRFAEWHLLIPKTIPRRIGLLTRNDALRLILDPVRGYVFFEAGIPDRILRLTAGHPYYTQVICQALVDTLNQKREFRVGTSQLEQVVGVVLENPPPPLSHVWDTLSSAGKVAAAGLSHALADDEASASAGAVLEGIPAELSAIVTDLVAFRGSLDSLCQDDWLERDDHGNYRFRIDLFRQWLRRERSVWQVADELIRGATV